MNQKIEKIRGILSGSGWSVRKEKGARTKLGNSQTKNLRRGIKKLSKKFLYFYKNLVRGQIESLHHMI